MNAYDLLNNYLDSIQSVDFAKSIRELRDLDRKNLTDAYLDKLNSGSTEMRNDLKTTPVNSLCYKERTPEKYKVYAVIPGVSKSDLTAKFVERENNKLIVIQVNKDAANKHVIECFSYLKFLKNPLRIVVPSDTTNPVLKLENGILEIQLDYVENTRKTEVLDIL